VKEVGWPAGNDSAIDGGRDWVRTGIDDTAILAVGEAMKAWADQHLVPDGPAGLKALVWAMGASASLGDRSILPGDATYPPSVERWIAGFVRPPRADPSSREPAQHELAFAVRIEGADASSRAIEVTRSLLEILASHYRWLPREER
jgi:hypothetical protein